MPALVAVERAWRFSPTRLMVCCFRADTLRLMERPVEALAGYGYAGLELSLSQHLHALSYQAILLAQQQANEPAAGGGGGATTGTGGSTTNAVSFHDSNPVAAL